VCGWGGRGASRESALWISSRDEASFRLPSASASRAPLPWPDTQNDSQGAGFSDKESPRARSCGVQLAGTWETEKRRTARVPTLPTLFFWKRGAAGPAKGRSKARRARDRSNTGARTRRYISRHLIGDSSRRDAGGERKGDCAGAVFFARSRAALLSGGGKARASEQRARARARRERSDGCAGGVGARAAV